MAVKSRTTLNLRKQKTCAVGFNNSNHPLELIEIYFRVRFYNIRLQLAGSADFWNAHLCTQGSLLSYCCDRCPVWLTKHCFKFTNCRHVARHFDMYPCQMAFVPFSLHPMSKTNYYRLGSVGCASDRIRIDSRCSHSYSTVITKSSMSVLLRVTLWSWTNLIISAYVLLSS